MTLYRHQVTVDTLLSDLAYDRQLARNLGQPTPAIKATEVMAKLVGLLVERKETGQPGDFSGLESRADVLSRVARDLGPDMAALLATLLEDQTARIALPKPDEG